MTSGRQPGLLVYVCGAFDIRQRLTVRYGIAPRGAQTRREIWCLTCLSNVWRLAQVLCKPQSRHTASLEVSRNTSLEASAISNVLSVEDAGRVSEQDRLQVTPWRVYEQLAKRYNVINIVNPR